MQDVKALDPEMLVRCDDCYQMTPLRRMYECDDEGCHVCDDCWGEHAHDSGRLVVGGG